MRARLVFLFLFLYLVCVCVRVCAWYGLIPRLRAAPLTVMCVACLVSMRALQILQLTRAAR